jgi:hypothetical protein
MLHAVDALQLAGSRVYYRNSSTSFHHKIITINHQSCCCRLTNALATTALAALALAQRLVREYPSAHALRLALLAELGLGDPSILLEVVLPGQRSGTADLHAPGAHALERVLFGEHVEVPQGEGGSELHIAAGRHTGCGQRDGRRELEVAEDGHAGCRVEGGGVRSRRVAACADAQELDLGHDEAVAAAVLAHDALQVSEALEVEDLLGCGLAAHASVPVVVALDETDDAAASVTKESLLEVGRVAGDELGLVAGTSGRLDGAHLHVAVALGDLEGSVDLVGVVVGADVVKSVLVLWLHVLTNRLRKVGLGDRDLKEGEDGRNLLNGSDVEVFPAAKVADVPPEVVVDTTGSGSDATDQSGGRVGAAEVLEQRRCSDGLVGIEAGLLGVGRVLDSRCRLEVKQREVECCGSKARGLLYLRVVDGACDEVRLRSARASHVVGDVAVGGETIAADGGLINALDRGRPHVTRRVERAGTGVGRRSV